MEAKSLLQVSQDYSLYFALPHSRYASACIFEFFRRGLKTTTDMMFYTIKVRSMLIPFGPGILGLRELLGASPELSTVEAHARRRLNKEVKKALETADPVLEVAAPILMKSPKESATLESHEEFYDAIMADDSDEEEDECDENEMVDKHEVSLVDILLSF